MLSASWREQSLHPIAAALAALLLAAAPAALAQPAAANDEAEPCPGLVAEGRSRIFPAALGDRANANGAVELLFVGHATFRIRSPGGVTIATDYNGC